MRFGVARSSSSQPAERRTHSACSHVYALSSSSRAPIAHRHAIQCEHTSSSTVNCTRPMIEYETEMRLSSRLKMRLARMMRTSLSRRSSRTMRTSLSDETTFELTSLPTTSKGRIESRSMMNQLRTYRRRICARARAAPRAHQVRRAGNGWRGKGGRGEAGTATRARGRWRARARARDAIEGARVARAGRARRVARGGRARLGEALDEREAAVTHAGRCRGTRGRTA